MSGSIHGRLFSVDDPFAEQVSGRFPLNYALVNRYLIPALAKETEKIKSMASNPETQASDAILRRRLPGGLRFILAVALLAVVVLCLIFSWTTRDAMANLPFLKQQADKRAFAIRNTPVEVRPWLTAQALAGLGVTAEEIEYARDAERLADHEVDQAFASALRKAAQQPRSLTAAALTLSRQIEQLQKVVKEDQAAVQKLTQFAPPKTELVPPLGVDDLAIAKAQLGLDSDELADAQRDFARAKGDERVTIQEQLAAHEAAMRRYDAQVRSPQPVALVSARQEATMATRVKAWLDQRTRYQLLQQALHETQADSIALTAQHDQLQNQTNMGISAATADVPQPGGSASPAHVSDKTATLAALMRKTAQRELLSIYDDRIQTQQQLATVYEKWSAQVLLQHRIILHLLLQSFALIALILFCVICFDTLIQHLVRRPALDQRRMYTRRILFTLGIQLVGLVLILLIIFGVPRQMPTIVGLTTAGLTVVLQDFILAFFGWFALTGKNGIRAGDWVEINGVGGEVVGVGLLRTTLLETGNWTDKGHPTGRRVTFINSFAVKGQYFNFSTAGQWMWDEITFSLPPTSDAYGVIELIYQAVVKGTEQETRLAEGELKRVTRKNDLSRFTANPAVSLRPGIYGIEIVIRYVTRASDRFEMRNRLYQCVIGLLHKPTMSRPDSSATELDQPQTPQVGLNIND
jgi:small-conductance mechanosensitive channel